MTRYVFHIVCFAFALILGSPTWGFAQDVPPSGAVSLPSKDNFRIVILAGQSNMAGRGFIEEEDLTPIPRVYMLDREGRWVPAVEPIHYDKPSAGVGPGREFARMLVDSNPEISVGLVPTACGGSSIDDWRPGVFFGQTNSYPYDDAVARAKRALKDGVLEAILWRQGESDISPSKSQKYEEKLIQLFSDLRSELHADNVPILVGELAMAEENNDVQTLRKAQISAVARSQPAAFVSAEGVTLNPDNIHFDRKSQLEQGKRFFYAFEKLKNEKDGHN